MDNLRKAIKILFEYDNPETVIQDAIRTQRIGKESSVYSMSYEKFRSYFSYTYKEYYTNDEIYNLYKAITSEWTNFHALNTKSIFNILIYFTYYKDVLQEEGGIPVVNYTQLLRWRDVTYSIGEDLLSTIYLAYKDTKDTNNRTVFSWKPILSTNNYRIKNILAKPIAENHFHLKGSSPHFNITWISLMNQIEGRNVEFEILANQNLQEPLVDFNYNEDHSSLSLLVKKAAAIRLLIFNYLKYNHNNMGVNRKCLIRIVQARSLQEIEMDLDEFQIQIDLAKYNYGKRFGKKIADYAIPVLMDDNNYLYNNSSYNGFQLLHGERQFLYMCFKRIFHKDYEFENFYAELFYAYILIKGKLRKELVQVNNRVGFDNFSIYERRKEIFLDNDEFYQKAVYNLAIHTSLVNSNSINESRITPKNTVSKISGAIEKITTAVLSTGFYDDISTELYYFENHLEREELYYRTGYVDRMFIRKRLNKFFFGMHFVKMQDAMSRLYNSNSDMLEVSNEFLLSTVCRNYNVRKKTEFEAKSIIDFKISDNIYRNRILMIDAANSEFFCRPEVYAKAYRYIRKYCRSIVGGRQAVIGYSYHVGEDFIDIVDGLRAIEETVFFLDLHNGDRLGHALALGIDPANYFCKKSYTIMIKRQVHLDNIAWLLNKCRKYGIDLRGIKDTLQREYEKHFSYIYGGWQQTILEDKEQNLNINNYSVMDYYDSWKLRGDCPYIYYQNSNRMGDVSNYSQMTMWDSVSLNYQKDLKEDLIRIRGQKRLTNLYLAYHFDAEVKRRGNSVVEFSIFKEYIEIVRDLQIHMQRFISKKRICIECNPTSNYLIGSFKRYADHPIAKFYNVGLTYESEELKKSAQLHVSINTDDQGVFATDLETEYSVMALAMEKEQDEAGALKYDSVFVYDWLDRIREMGWEQSFIHRLDKSMNSNIRSQEVEESKIYKV